MAGFPRYSSGSPTPKRIARNCCRLGGQPVDLSYSGGSSKSNSGYAKSGGYPGSLNFSPYFAGDSGNGACDRCWIYQNKW
jgi:hypothetical protein